MSKTFFPPYSHLTKRYPRRKLDEIRSVVSEHFWMAQYQCEPSLGDLAFFKTEHLPRYDFPNVIRCWTAWDCANTATKAGSFSAGVALGLTNDRRLALLDVRRGRWSQDVLEEQIVDHTRSVARLTGIVPEAVIVERAAAGYGIIDRLSSVLPILPLIPKGSKEDRAAAVCSFVNRGQVLFPEQASWLGAFLEELASFPLGRTKDQVDSFVHALSFAGRPSEFPVIEMSAGVAYSDGKPRTDEEIIEHQMFLKEISFDSWKDDDSELW